MTLPYCTANIFVTNKTSAVAQIALAHSVGGNSPVEAKQWANVPAGATTPDPLVVHFTLHSLDLDWWWCEIIVNGVTYWSPGTALNPDKECLLEQQDCGQTMYFTVDTQNFEMNITSGGCSTYMTDGGI